MRSSLEDHPVAIQVHAEEGAEQRQGYPGRPREAGSWNQADERPEQDCPACDEPEFAADDHVVPAAREREVEDRDKANQPCGQ